MFKILVLKQDNLNTTASFEKTKQYFLQKGINVSFEFKTVNIPVSISSYKEVQGFNPNTGQPGIVKYFGLDSVVRLSCIPHVTEGQYQAVIFSYNMDTVKPILPMDGIVTSWSGGTPLYPSTEFIQLCTNQYFLDNDKTWKAISHEVMHSFCWYLQRKGIPALDEMDYTRMPNGQIIPFYKNDDPYAVDGNYAQTLENLKPHISKLYPAVVVPPVPPTTNYFKTQEFVPRSVYDKFKENSIWFIDPRIVKLANFVRTFFGKPVTINNWHTGGAFQERGFRIPESTTGATLSQHRFGRAIDVNVAGMTPKAVYEAIMANEKAFMGAGLTTMEALADTPGWTHLDIRNTGSDRILIVNA